MARITMVERIKFHALLDESIDKLDNPRNIGKEHWRHSSINSLQKHINVENAELEEAVYNADTRSGCDDELIETECFDLINLSLFILDNLRNNE